MKLLHVVPSYIPAWRYGGPIRSVHGLCKGLARRGHDVHVFTTNVDGPDDSDVPLAQAVDLDGVKVWYYPSHFLRRLYYSRAMKAALRERAASFDLLQLHSVFLWPTNAAARQAERAGVPYVVSPKGMLVREFVRMKSRWLKTLWIALIERRTLERAAGIQLTSQHEFDELAHFPGANSHPILIPHGIDPPQGFGPPEAPVASVDPAELVFLGRVNWEKGLDRLIPAMKHVETARLTIAGNDEEGLTPRLEQLAREHGVSERVRFVGEVKDDAKWQLLRDATLVVLPSYSENFGIAAIEAMAVGTAVALTPEVGLAGAVVDSGSGIVADGRPESFGPALQQLLREPDRIAAMGRRAYDTVRREFTWDSVAERHERFYECLIRSRRSS